VVHAFSPSAVGVTPKLNSPHPPPTQSQTVTLLDQPINPFPPCANTPAQILPGRLFSPYKESGTLRSQPFRICRHWFSFFVSPLTFALLPPSVVGCFVSPLWIPGLHRAPSVYFSPVGDPTFSLDISCLCHRRRRESFYSLNPH